MKPRSQQRNSPEVDQKLTEVTELQQELADAQGSFQKKEIQLKLNQAARELLKLTGKQK